MVTDARSNTKTWITTHWLASNITKDDGVTQAGTQCMYDYPDYPVTLELKAPSVVCGLILIGEPNSTPMFGHDLTTYGYEEHVPVILATVDRTGVTGTKLRWKMEAELRRIAENYPIGSQRSLEKRSDKTERLGSTTVYMAEYILNFIRGTT